MSVEGNLYFPRMRSTGVNRLPRRNDDGPAPHVDVSVLIPVLNEEGVLARTVSAMQRQEFPGTVEFIFIDGASSDRSREVLRELAQADRRIRVLDNPERTTAKALNIGLLAARGTYVARMDAHAFYPADYLRRGVQRLEEGGVEWVAGPQNPVGRGEWSSVVARVLNSPGGSGPSNKWGPQENEAEYALSTSVFTGVWRRSVLDQLGGWDPGWPVNQDSEMAARVIEKGGVIICIPEMRADYIPRDSPRKLARQYFRFGQYRAKTFLRHPSSLGIRRVVLAGVPVLPLVAIAPNRLRVPARWTLAAYFAVVGAQVVRLRPRNADDSFRITTVLLIMHSAWGSGFLLGLARFGARSRVLRTGRPAPFDR